MVERIHAASCLIGWASRPPPSTVTDETDVTDVTDARKRHACAMARSEARSEARQGEAYFEAAAVEARRMGTRGEVAAPDGRGPGGARGVIAPETA
eukprot:CAMPEP_0181219400 /NCGR_PEP_ID=MMETSP1096-20121128/28246_1 /TAXON_ID=156174 ORGANISM="Chrysochromulina ericina, Strain CCMP281" /NCGR_SAMPLE_ID=MMETSP1096 /ASSEMBLY_ACC=CAM_ASM_000453 /LENGTH=95 /DNA_ID=CAMNT_0023311759 /DNA_START=283 /DNA_END=568 /DNA_ORIENTATION=+